MMEARHSRWFAGSVPNRENGGSMYVAGAGLCFY